MWHTGCFVTWSLTSNKKKNQHKQAGTQNRAAHVSRARRGHMQRRRGHRTCRRKSRPLNTSINQEKRGYKEKPSPKQGKKTQKETHRPYDGDGLHGPNFGPQDGPRATSWPNLSIPHGCSVLAWRADILCPSAGCAATSACQIRSQ